MKDTKHMNKNDVKNMTICQGKRNKIIGVLWRMNTNHHKVCGAV